jgi:hypothetical protein
MRQSVSVCGHEEVQRDVLHCCSPHNVVLWRPYGMHVDETGVMNAYDFTSSHT